jgi:hypothetical protein
MLLSVVRCTARRLVSSTGGLMHRSLSSSSALDPIKVFGHKVPDTDTVCSAMIREWDLNGGS